MPRTARNRCPRSARPRSGSPPAGQDLLRPGEKGGEIGALATPVHPVLEHGDGAFVDGVGRFQLAQDPMAGKVQLEERLEKGLDGEQGRGKKLPTIAAASSRRRKKPKRLLGNTTAVKERSLPSRCSSTRAPVRSTRSSWRPISSSIGPPRPHRGRHRGESRGIFGREERADRVKVACHLGLVRRAFFGTGLEVEDQDLVRADLQAVEAPEFRRRSQRPTISFSR